MQRTAVIGFIIWQICERSIQKKSERIIVRVSSAEWLSIVFTIYKVSQEIIMFFI